VKNAHLASTQRKTYLRCEEMGEDQVCAITEEDTLLFPFTFPFEACLHNAEA